MTLPDERYRSVLRTADFLLKIAAHPRITRGVPKALREEAMLLLKHFPTYYDLQQLERLAPGLFKETMDPLHRMVAAYEDMTPEKDQVDSSTAAE